VPLRLWRVRIAGLRAKQLGDVAALEALAREGLDDDPAAWVALADEYNGVELYDAAHAAVDRALQLDPDSAGAIDTMFELALAGGDLVTLHNTSEALAAAKPLWHQGPEHLGRSFARRCEPGPALLHAKRGVELAPYCHNAWLGLGEAHLVAGDLDAARAALARSLAIDASTEDVAILKAALDRQPDVLERALAERYQHLPALPFAAFVAKLRAAATS
jgi:tetratricopeptide (TPR) repeat protein